MSYCRFSSMNWRSDVYVYEHVDGGWTTHVAGRRRWIQPIPELSSSVSQKLYKWSGAKYDMETRKFSYPSKIRRAVYHAWLSVSTFWYRQFHLRSLDMIPLRPIGLRHDGETFSDPTPISCALRLLELRSIGYFVPEYAVENLLKEGTGAGESP